MLAGFFDAIEVDPKTKRPKSWDWKSCLKLMKSPEQFMDKLISFKNDVDANKVPGGNVTYVK